MPKETKDNIKRQIKGLVIGKLCTTTRNSFDNIFISSFIGLTQVAVYGNYFYILNAVHELLGVFNNAALGGIGNSIAKDSQEKNYRDFQNITFLYAWLSGWFVCCLLCLYQHFMLIWMNGNQKLIFPVPTMILCAVYLYILSMGDVKNIYSTARGLWWENRSRSICEMIGNVVLNFTLGKFFGVNGIILATIITMLFINFTMGSQVLFKEYFTNGNLMKFFFNHGLYATVTVIVCFVTYTLCSFLPSAGWTGLILKAILCVFVPNILFYIIYFKTKRFKQSKELFIKVVKVLPLINKIFH